MISALVAAALLSGSATAYHTCDGSTTQTASGQTVRVGFVAANNLPLGTWVEMRSPRRVMNRRWFRVMDTGGPGFALDFYAESCAWMNSFGRRHVTYRVVPRSELYRGKPYKGWKLRRSAKGARLKWSAR
jgi:3D (Asp-Asp-Asp) domain-containing protein